MVKRNKARIIDKFKASGDKLVPIKEEMRCNLTAMIKKRKDVFPGIIDYSDTDTIIPGQDITFFGERGQTESTPASSFRFRRGSG